MSSHKRGRKIRDLGIYHRLGALRQRHDNIHKQMILCMAFRVFDGNQAASKKITVKDYHSLTENPELILYDGWYNTRQQAEIKKR